MKYPTVRIKALGDRRFEVLPAIAYDTGGSSCWDQKGTVCHFFNCRCGDAFKICKEFPVIFKEIK